MNKLIRFLPLFLVIALFSFLYKSLSINPKVLPSALINKPFPEFNLPDLLSSTQQDSFINKSDLKGKIILLNVWATWCSNCKYEQPYLMKLAQNPSYFLYGLNYKDDKQAAINWLSQYKNPFIKTIYDKQGSLGLDLGVYGAPETFLIDQSGTIRKRYAGPIDEITWQKEFLNLVNKIKNEQQMIALED
ncbi:DsbE family thiol:disulfide interchange protein [Pseudoalteromonas denitrificans]|uniref:Cytochrome c biogenesis protein CcmG, thiol:disulfide interchange protein DsbE n=1 Tax=Pseudoalteromonas denitrificans DSM 6059 TaxID=1123010 RepID=A0A1I1FRT1_9GAMM|nr:DsbE family thiol:disulfide interchange protein [Pseudoalteromonas denitrificans]SFC01696.1 cytochrome c biogenesis protein CcmG, thiol:disulfide interchange protein DsbE [Pseudoalteromonas denitrificans DSM 6059]